MRRSQDGNRVRGTKELPVVEFALILWLLFIFILVVFQANQNRQPRFMDLEGPDGRARDGDIFRSQRGSIWVPSLNPISTMKQVVQESVYCQESNATCTPTMVHNPVSLSGQAGSGPNVLGDLSASGDLGEVWRREKAAASI